MSYSVRIDGFKTKEQAEAFYQWYEGQGEQDILSWIEYNSGPRRNGAWDNFNTDMKLKPNWVDNTYVFKIQGEK